MQQDYFDVLQTYIIKCGSEATFHFIEQKMLPRLIDFIIQTSNSNECDVVDLVAPLELVCQILTGTVTEGITSKGSYAPTSRY